MSEEERAAVKQNSSAPPRVSGEVPKASIMGQSEAVSSAAADAASADAASADAFVAGGEVDPEAAEALEKRLTKRGDGARASKVRARRVEVDQQLAKAFIAMKNLDTKRARQLERRVAKEGDETTACELRKARMVMDRERANEILSSPTDDHVEMLELAQSLKQYKDAGTARRVLALSCDRISKDKFPGIYRATFQQAALATYKDPDLPIEWKLDRAHELLTKTESLAECRDSETLGIAGAIFKRRWEYDGQRQNLERALFYYLKGYAQGAPAAAQGDVLGYLRDHPDATFDARADQGYTGVNAAFVLDLLAAQEEEEAHQVGFVSAIAKQRRECARAIRQEISRSVPALLEQDGFEWLEEKWWFYATLGEALFGLGEYERALEWLMAKPRAAGLRIGFDLDSSVGLQVPEWEYESTARQLAQLGRMQSESEHQRAGGSSRISEEEFTSTPAAQALKRFLRGEELAVRSSFRGKFGLGLSGGGFRASFFHIGVLARLAEIDALGHVEVLSCVSGGSIVGAYYYLEVRKLLQTKADAEITPQDYVEIVKRLETEFLAGVQRNIRMRVLGELSTNLKMIFSARYSRTLRVGELYERELYARITDSEGNTSPRSGPRWLPDLFARLFNLKREQRLLKDLRIYPKIGVDAAGKANLQTDFSPRSDNWRRRNKAPILVLNASSLNTGHNWQFTASYMGEPPLPIQADIDCNYRLRRFYFDEQNAPTNARPITLGQAVAASSCVPGLFEPIILDDLYPDDSKRRISVRLVDGGVCDNQGVASLLEQDCTMMLVSDGSGQMDAEDVPSAGLLGVPLRSNSILQARVRETQYGDIESRRRAKLLRGLMFVHLKQDLPSRALAWRNCPPAQKQSDVYELSFDARAETSGVTRYGVSRDIQRKLAAVRTDLDSFSDAEAYALMASGYCMAAEQFRGVDPCVSGFPNPAFGDWRFRAIEPAMMAGNHDPRLEKLLDVAKETAFKIWRLEPVLVFLKWALAALAGLGLGWLFIERWSEPLLPEPWRSWLNAKLTFQWVALSLLSVALTAILAFTVNSIVGAAHGKKVLRVVHWRDTLKDIAIGVAMSLLGWLIARLHLYVFDRLYLRYGRLKNLLK